MSRIPTVLTVLLTWMSGVPLAQQQPTPQQPPATTFRSAVEVVSVTAVVTDRKGKFVRDLGRDDFTVMDGGQQRPILDFRAQADGPVKVALLIDISGSMRLSNKALDARTAALQIFSAMRPEDQAALYAFDTRLERVSGFTSDVSSLTAALDRVEPPYGQTSLYDAVADTARRVVSEQGGNGPGAGPVAQRVAVVVLTDGVDTHSQLSAEAVSAIASGIDVPVYVVAVMPSVDDPRLSVASRALDGAAPLLNLSRSTGGELFIATAPAHLSIAARRIVEELRHQYVFAFEAAETRGWRPVEIRARNRGHIVRARSGYTVGGEGQHQ